MKEETMEFAGKTAVVTGASSGIGRATAELLGKQGARVAVHYNNNHAGAQEAVSAIRAGGSEATAIRGDLSVMPDIEKLKRETHDVFGPIDILINNAGGLIERCPLRTMREDLYDALMDINVKSLVFVTQAFLDDMIGKKKGAIVNMASIAARHGGGPGSGVYAASKAAALCLTKAMAKEFLAYGIRVNAVNPGVIQTPFHAATPPEMMKQFVASIPAARAGTAAEIAEVIVFLASERSSYIVGETVEINGGQLME
ncbi:MAG: SDR family NAD(P)-dependent oxidoreductase [Acidobacteriota bacterium]